MADESIKRVVIETLLEYGVIKEKDINDRAAKAKAAQDAAEAERARLKAELDAVS